MRIELKIALLFTALAFLINHLSFLPEDIACFLCGLFISLGLFFMIVNALPQKTYENLFYRKLLAKINK